MIITSGQGITPKQLKENSVIRRAETHKINSTFKIPTFFQTATGGAYVDDVSDRHSSKYVYIDGAKVYSADGNDANDAIEKAISHVPQLIKTFRTKLISTKIENTDKLIIKSFSFTSTPPLSYSYYTTNGGFAHSYVYSISFPNRSIFKYSKKFDDILNCTLPGSLTIEKDGIYLTEQYVCTRELFTYETADGKTIMTLSPDEITAINNGTFKMPFTCNFEISFIEFK